MLRLSLAALLSVSGAATIAAAELCTTAVDVLRAAHSKKG